MIVGYFNLVRVTVSPEEANTILSIDPNRMLTFPVSLEQFELVSRRGAKIAQAPRIVEHDEFASRDTLERAETSNVLALPKTLGITIAEASDHLPLSI